MGGNELEAMLLASTWPLCGVQGSRSFSPPDLSEGTGKRQHKPMADRRASPKDSFQDLREEGLPW